MASAWQILRGIRAGDHRTLARALTLVENDLDLSNDILFGLETNSACKVIGITGSPGAGKSTLVNSLIKRLISADKKIAVLAIDPTSPFNFGSLLGDRIRMSEHFTNQNVFIRSVAARGSLGGLSAKIIEMTDVLRASHFDYIIIETVGVGQSEVEVAGLADITIVVLVPGSGDEVQMLKSGLMEIADIFVVNKADHPGADHFVNNLKKLVHQKASEIPILKTIADTGDGVDALAKQLEDYTISVNNFKPYLITEKAYRLIREKRMYDIKKDDLRNELTQLAGSNDFNLYRFVDGKIRNS